MRSKPEMIFMNAPRVEYLIHVGVHINVDVVVHAQGTQSHLHTELPDSSPNAQSLPRPSPRLY